MKLNELKPPAPPEPPPAWKLQLRQFWREASDLERIDMRVTLEMGDATGAQRILESWQQQVVERRRARRKSKKKSARRRFQYGVYGGWFYPGFHNDSGADSSSAAADGGGGGESIREQQAPDLQIVLPKFVAFCCDALEIKNQPRIRLRKDPAWSERNGTFGRFDHDRGHIELSVANRHVMDVLRTLAHELVHHRQAQDQALPQDAGRTGSPWEDEANALAGRIMRDFVEQNPDVFGQDLDEGWRERAAGLATAACVAGTPGCATTGTTTAADALRTVQTIGRVATNPPTRAGAEEELRQELKNIINRGRGTNVEPRIRESSGYIPTEAQKDDPRFSMALTQDIRPGETGRQANKLGLKTDSQGRPDLLMARLQNHLKMIKEGLDVPTHSPESLAKKHGVSVKTIKDQLAKGVRVEQEHTTDLGLAREIALDHLAEFPDYYDRLSRAETDEKLTEVAMNPGTYRRFLASKDSAGIQAGFEAELVFRDAEDDSDDSETMPDWDYDERAGDINDIIDFFTNGDNPMSQRAANRLRQDLTEQFMDWAREQFDNDYFNQDRLMSWAEENVWPDEADSYREDARANLDDDATDKDVEREAVALFRDDVERDWDRSGAWYERATEELYDEYMGDLDQQDWLDSEGLQYMSSVATEYDLEWPYWTGGDGGGSRSGDDIGKSLSQATGLPVTVSSGYHNVSRRPGEYVLEPDSSIEADAGESGLEVVSPPLPLPQALEQLKKVIDWANDRNGGNAYTNSSTGLHMGVSLPYKGGDVDPIKLILFMGDKELLERFDRQSNTYARSALDRLQTKIRNMRDAGPKQIQGIMELMKKNLIELAHRDLQSGVLGNKYVSVNPHQGYIEFRGPGGDYLAKADEIDGVLENTMMQLAYAMHIAGKPDLYRDEYAKKLYKTLTGFRGAETSKGPRSPRYRTEIETETDDPFMRLFADYSARRINAAGLKERWAEAVLAAEKATDGTKVATSSASQEYEVFDRDTGTSSDPGSRTVIDTFPADSDEDAVEIALQKWTGRGVDFGVRRKMPEPDGAKDRRAEVARRIKQRTMKQAATAAAAAADEFLAKAREAPIPFMGWRVAWTEQRDGETVEDAVVIQARSRPEAIDRIRQALDLSGRQGRDFEAEPMSRGPSTDPAAAAANTDIGEPRPNTTRNPDANWAIVRRSNGEIVIPFTRNTEPEALEYFRSWAWSRVGNAGAYQLVPLTARPVTGTPAAGEWTGRWLVQSTATGETVHTISGIGNVQADANRHAERWVRSTGFDDPIEVVPELQ